MENILNLEDASFDAAQVVNHTLSVLLTRDGFSFCVSDNSNGVIRRITHVEVSNPGSGLAYLQVDNPMADILRGAYSRIFLVHNTRKLALVPDAYSLPDSDAAYFSFNYSGINSLAITRTELPDAGAIMVYQQPEGLQSFSSFFAVKPMVLPAGAVLVQSLLRENSHILTRQAFINVWKGCFDLVVIQGSKLLYFNTFDAATASDMVYYVVFVMEQLGFNPTAERICLMGQTNASSDEYSMLAALFENLSFYPPTKVVFPPAWQSSLDTSRYFTLLSVTSCGL